MTPETTLTPEMEAIQDARITAATNGLAEILADILGAA